ncbi:hypothetical protein X946_5530 [Burkholderia sp. ABCPW 111]|nr:hypothetical protein X946_5530 [Burkholderia sp. ABCPW 111]
MSSRFLDRSCEGVQNRPYLDTSEHQAVSQTRAPHSIRQHDDRTATHSSLSRVPRARVTDFSPSDRHFFQGFMAGTLASDTPGTRQFSPCNTKTNQVFA